MDWEYYIDSDLSNSIVRGCVSYSLFRFWYKNITKSNNTINIIKNIENEIWHPRKCFINMKTNTRIFYTIFTGILGIAAIKHLYFYLRHKNELEMKINDYLIIGGISGIFVTQISLGGIYTLYGGLIGMFYGSFYCMMVKYFVQRRKGYAEKIGITL